MITNSWSGASFGQPLVKGCYHCGRMVRDLEGAPQDAVACNICINAGYKQPPSVEEQTKNPEASAEAFKNLGPKQSDRAVVPNIKNPSDVAVHKADEKELLT